MHLTHQPPLGPTRTPCALETCCSAPARSRSTRARTSSSVSRRRPDGALPGEPGGGLPRRRSDARRRGSPDRLHDGDGVVRGDQRGLRVILRVRPTGAGRDRGRGAPTRGRWSRSTRWWRSLTDTVPARDATAALTVEEIRRAAEAGAGIVRQTPVLSSGTLSSRAGVTVALKTENLQRTGSFKLRGALAKLAALGEEVRGRRRHRERRQPRPGARLCGPGAGSALRGVHAPTGGDRQGRSCDRAGRDGPSRRIDVGGVARCRAGERRARPARVCASVQ